MPCCGQTTTDTNQYTIEEPVYSAKPMTALEIIQGLKVTRTPNEPKPEDKKDN